MNIALVGFIIIVILLIIILIYLLTIKKNISNTANKNQVKMNIKLFEYDLNNIKFPKNIEQMNSDSLTKASKVIFDSYKSLDYANKVSSSLDKIEWHTWQVSIILYFLKTKGKYYISNDIRLFHDVILELNENQIEQEMQRVCKKYMENIDIYKDRDYLSNQVIWSARDVSIILYKIINS
jgi:competence protein ComGC